MGEVFTALIGGSVGAAIVAGVFSLLRWGLDRKAVKDDRAEDIEATAEEKLANVIAGQRMLLYMEIKRLAKDHLREKSITTEDLEDLVEMHGIYHDRLSGNGFLDSLMHQVRKLPIDDHKREEVK